MLQNSQKWHNKRKIYLCRMLLLGSFFIISMILILISNKGYQSFLFSKILPFTDIKTNNYNNMQVTKDFIGILLLLLILVLFLSVYFYLFEREFINSCKDMIAVSTILILNLFLIKFLTPIPTFAIPACMGIVLISLLIDVRIAIVFNIVVSIITLLIVGDKNLDFALYLFIGGSLSSIVSHKIQSRMQFISHGFLASLISALFVLAIELVYQTDEEMVLYNPINSFVGTALSFVLAYGTLPIWEYIFDYATPIRLMELSNPNHPLLKRLLLEAPGTYHHSLIVGNLAEVACEAVGGNYLLARIGAYYHDIGKLKRPFYFKENQIVEEDPHNKITPTLSALIITSHTKDGVEIGKEYKLPKQVLDIIRQHHGTTKVAFFYGKALIQNQQVSEQKFRYEGPVPQSKEAAIVMLADSVEAAVRALSSPTPQLIETTIRGIIYEKLMDGQLNSSNLTFKELETICESFIKVLTGVFHKRVSHNLVDDTTNKMEEVVSRSENLHSKSAG
ncbi:HDIG domain-containing protein [Caldicellulosiruptor changbaiensis]|uniref:HDIG domain-containing protein n=1 Tax=Caldicellulosiruptor changbaiensis TaxID=1222016 RepID=A0A3T0D9Q9_9FIRM|nr:HDIG domain-containing protein [Caldicellulosiruptor changbaiensis]